MHLKCTDTRSLHTGYLVKADQKKKQLLCYLVSLLLKAKYMGKSCCMRFFFFFFFFFFFWPGTVVNGIKHIINGWAYLSGINIFS